MRKTVPLSALAKIIRSKNAGPFRVTFDVLMPDKTSYEIVQQSGGLTRRTIAHAYGISENQISSLFAVPMGFGFIITFLRPLDQCGLGETVVFGCQQHVPLMSLPIEVD
jgi:hypothetical protein